MKQYYQNHFEFCGFDYEPGDILYLEPSGSPYEATPGGAWRIVSLDPAPEPDHRGQHRVTLERPAFPVRWWWTLKIKAVKRWHLLKCWWYK